MDRPQEHRQQREPGSGRRPKIGAGIADSRQARSHLKVARAWGVSPRRFDGWEPDEIHEHYDAEGNLTGRTRVIREAEWNDEARGRAIRLAEYEASLCLCGCGLPVEVAHDPNRAFVVHQFRCGARRAIQIKKRDDAAENKDKTGWDDGLSYFALPHDED